MEKNILYQWKSTSFEENYQSILQFIKEVGRIHGSSHLNKSKHKKEMCKYSVF